MKIKVKQFLIIYNIISKLYSFSFPANISYKIFLFQKDLTKHYEFFIQQEEKILKESNGEIERETGKITFKEDVDKNKFLEEHSKLFDLEVEIEDNHCIQIPINQITQKLSISPEEIDNLKPFISFYEEE